MFQKDIGSKTSAPQCDDDDEDWYPGKPNVDAEFDDNTGEKIRYEKTMIRFLNLQINILREHIHTLHNSEYCRQYRNREELEIELGKVIEQREGCHIRLLQLSHK